MKSCKKDQSYWVRFEMHTCCAIPTSHPNPSPTPPPTILQVNEAADTTCRAITTSARLLENQQALPKRAFLYVRTRPHNHDQLPPFVPSRQRSLHVHDSLAPSKTHTRNSALGSTRTNESSCCHPPPQPPAKMPIR